MFFVAAFERLIVRHPYILDKYKIIAKITKSTKQRIIVINNKIELKKE
jgi:hypothetical protein